MKITPFTNKSRLHWSQRGPLGTVYKDAPESSGVYLFGAVERVEGVDLALSPLYIGRATNLRRRLLAHYRDEKDLQMQASEDVKGLVLVSFAQLPPASVNQTEIALIRRLDPTFNRIRYKEIAEAI